MTPLEQRRHAWFRGAPPPPGMVGWLTVTSRGTTRCDARFKVCALRIRAFPNIQRTRQLGLAMCCTSSFGILLEPRAGALFTGRISNPMPVVRGKSTVMLTCVQTLNLSVSVAVSSVTWFASITVRSCGSLSAPQCNSGNRRILRAFLNYSYNLTVTANSRLLDGHWHADFSSAAAELYAAASCVNDALASALSCVCVRRQGLLSSFHSQFTSIIRQLFQVRT